MVHFNGFLDEYSSSGGDMHIYIYIYPFGQIGIWFAEEGND